jgi:hypothetical protein
VTASDPGISITKTFQLTVQTETGCSPFAAGSNFAPATDSPYATQSYPSVVQIGDFNNDGIQDSIVGNTNSNSISVYTGTGTGGFAPAVNIPTVGGTVLIYLTVNDFNRDGHQDIAAAYLSSKNIIVLLGDGTGAFTQSPGFPATSTTGNPFWMTSADFNGDGVTDLAVTYTFTDMVSIFIGTETGGFTEQTPIMVGDFPYSIVKGFFDNDSIVDLAVANGSSPGADPTQINRVSILLGNGDGTFTRIDTPQLNPGALTASIADFDNDGDQDIAVDSSLSHSLSILIGDGTGAFTVGNSVPVGFESTGIITGDMDGDGNPDILASSRGLGTTVSIQRGNGDGTFTAAGTLSASRPLEYAIGDFNNDDRQDFIVIELNANRIAAQIGQCHLDITNEVLPVGQQLAPYNADVDAAGGHSPYIFSAEGLPAGLMINSGTGEITGIPTESGTFYPRITVAESAVCDPTNSAASFKTFESLAPAGINEHFQVLRLDVFAPTAAVVSVQGRVLTANGRGIPNASVQVTTPRGEIRTARANPFGYYRFTELEAGQTYVFSVRSKRYVFAPQVVGINEDLTGLNFIAIGK